MQISQAVVSELDNFGDEFHAPYYQRFGATSGHDLARLAVETMDSRPFMMSPLLILLGHVCSLPRSCPRDSYGGELAIFSDRSDLVFECIIENPRRFWENRPTSPTPTEASIHGFTADFPRVFGSMLNDPELRGDIVMAHRAYRASATARLQ